MHIRDLVLIPQYSFSRIQGQLVDDLCLEAPSLVRADHDFYEEVNPICPGIILGYQPAIPKALKLMHHLLASLQSLKTATSLSAACNDIRQSALAACCSKKSRQSAGASEVVQNTAQTSAALHTLAIGRCHNYMMPRCSQLVQPVPQLLRDQELELFRLKQVQILAEGVSLLHRSTVGQSQVSQFVHVLVKQPLHL